jgi:predicted aspartyl protease
LGHELESSGCFESAKLTTTPAIAATSKRSHGDLSGAARFRQKRRTLVQRFTANYFSAFAEECYHRRVVTRNRNCNSGKRLAALFLFLAFTFPALAANRAQIPSGRVQFEALPLARSLQNHLLIRAYINGKPALMVLDTGAPVSAIAISRRSYFGLSSIPGASQIPARVKINGAFNSMGIAKTLRLGALTLIDQPMVTVDLSSSTHAAHMTHEPRIDGILGADILFPLEAVLDCQKQTLILKMDTKRRGGVPGADYRGFRSMPIHVTAGDNLYVDGKVNGLPAQLMVDTGAFATLLHRPFVRRMKIPTRETEFSSSGVNIARDGVQVALIKRLSVGTFEIKGKEVGVIDLEGLIHGGMLEATPPVAGLLGSEILQRHHGIIDFGTRTLYLKD